MLLDGPHIERDALAKWGGFYANRGLPISMWWICVNGYVVPLLAKRPLMRDDFAENVGSG